MLVTHPPCLAPMVRNLHPRTQRRESSLSEDKYAHRRRFNRRSAYPEGRRVVENGPNHLLRSQRHKNQSEVVTGSQLGR